MSLKLALSNWLSHDETVIHLERPIGFIVAENGVGKTAVRDALEFAFLGTGQLRGIRTKAELGQLSIREGERECTVRLDLPHFHLVRTMKASGVQKIRFSDNDEMRPEEIQARDFDRRMGLKPDVFRMCLDPWGWWTLDETRRRELLMAATAANSEVTLDELLAAFETHVEPATDDDRAAIRLVCEKIVADGFRAAETLAVERRKELKRRRAAVHEPDPPDPHFEDVSLEQHATEAFENRLRDIRRQLEQAQRDVGEESGVLAGKVEAANERLTQLLATRIPGDPDPECAADYATLSDQIVPAKERLETARLAASAAKARVSELKAQIPDDRGGYEHPGQCPAIAVPMKCPAKLATFEKAIQAADENVPALRAQLDEAVSDWEEAKARVINYETSLSALEGEIRSARERSDRERRRADAQSALDIEISEAESRLSDLEAAWEASKSRGDARERVESLRASVAKGEAVIAAKKGYDTALETIQAATREKADLLVKIERWDALATWLKPEGIETKVGGVAGELFLGFLKDFEPAAGAIELTSDFSIRVGPEKRHLSQLSVSQRYLIGAALQAAFGRMQAFPILCLDALDTLSPTSRQRLLPVLKAVAKGFDAVLGLATVSTRPGPPPPGCQTFYLEAPAGAVVVSEPDS